MDFMLNSMVTTRLGHWQQWNARKHLIGTFHKEVDR